MSRDRSRIEAPAATLDGVDESTWLDVIQKMDEVYTRLIADEVELEKKNAELEQSQQFILSVLGAMSDVLIVCDGQGRIEQVNAALCQLVGRSEESLCGVRFEELLADDGSAAMARAAMAQVDGVNARQGIELQLLDRTGQAVPVDASCAPRRIWGSIGTWWFSLLVNVAENGARFCLQLRQRG